ncbi:hypothetical protein F4808DRAFT_407455 [Astrocystis sublimbata]|nr:hypothetical protein F4808DRAFT_407455 [Astrocystis sublimbata]
MSSSLLHLNLQHVRLFVTALASGSTGPASAFGPLQTHEQVALPHELIICDRLFLLPFFSSVCLLFPGFSLMYVFLNLRDLFPALGVVWVPASANGPFTDGSGVDP